MWSRFKALPTLPKALVLILFVGILYKAGTTNPHRSPVTPSPWSSDNNGPVREARSEEARSDTDAPAPRSDQNQALIQYKAEQSQLMAQASQCEREMTEATNRQAQAAMNGQFYNARPACEAQMPAYISREAFLETEIYRLQTGDRTSSMSQITGVQVGSRADTPRAAGSGRSSDGTEAVEDWDRGAIRGTSLYNDEDGQTHELATQDYYYRDRSSGRIIGSSQPNPPNDGRDYEQFQPAQRPQ